MTEPDFDAVVVGASVAGCTAARLFAQRGARVALVERRPDLDAYKTVCTHYIQPSATPTIERLGLAALIEEHGAVRNSIDLWTPYGGWIRHRGDAPYGYNVTRQVLDPLLRRMTAETPGVELLPGCTATELLGDGDGSRGVVVEDRHRARRALRGRLVVAADGRDTHVAGWPASRAACARTTASSTGPTGAASSRPTTARGCGSWSPTAPTPSPTRTASASSSPRRTATACPSSATTSRARTCATSPRCRTPPTSAAPRASPSCWASSTCRTSAAPAARPGLAFVGDAALASDPLWGVGCGWAFQSAEWLVEETADALVGGGDLDAALDSYRKVHRRRLGPHHFLISDIATARPANPLERAMYRSAVSDDEVYRTFEAIGARRRSPAALFAPGTLARLVRA